MPRASPCYPRIGMKVMLFGTIDHVSQDSLYGINIAAGEVPYALCSSHITNWNLGNAIESRD